MNPSRRTRFVMPVLLLLLLVSASGCGILARSIQSPTPTPEPRVLVPTFTPTPAEEVQVQQALEQPADQPAQAEEPQEAPAEEPVATDTPEPEPTATPEPEPIARAVISSNVANIRQGPGTTYGLVGAANNGTELAIIGKNPEGGWWQICCVNGEPGWVFGDLVNAENTDSVEVAQNIPAPPPPPTQPPPTNTPEPVAPPPAADPDLGPCGGDDGCKFKVRGGPSLGGNGGLDLKMQLLFVHGGRGEEPQGSYFIVLKKDGVNVGVPDSVRSIAKNKSQGQLGDYNYEYAIGAGNLPGGNVAGNYIGWVLDGNGERDSEPFTFNIPDGQQGLLWIKFDQN